MKTFEFTLSEPIQYQEEGEHVSASLLELTAPSAKNRKKVAKLKQGFMRAIIDLPTDSNIKATEKKESDIKPEEVLNLIQMGSIEYDDYIDIFVDLITNGVCKIDGKVDITKIRVDEMDCNDLEKLMGEYLVNFIIGSLGK